MIIVRYGNRMSSKCMNCYGSYSFCSSVLYVTVCVLFYTRCIFGSYTQYKLFFSALLRYLPIRVNCWNTSSYFFGGFSRIAILSIYCFGYFLLSLALVRSAQVAFTALRLCSSHDRDWITNAVCVSVCAVSFLRSNLFDLQMDDIIYIELWCVYAWENRTASAYTHKIGLKKALRNATNIQSYFRFFCSLCWFYVRVYVISKYLLQCL